MNSIDICKNLHYSSSSSCSEFEDTFLDLALSSRRRHHEKLKIKNKHKNMMIVVAYSESNQAGHVSETRQEEGRVHQPQVDRGQVGGRDLQGGGTAATGCHRPQRCSAGTQKLMLQTLNY